ncbi:MAG: MFS transporter [Verrucomicrobia bacterium]|nr:MFS transporter [Verrucomicrobiota bacterium]
MKKPSLLIIFLTVFIDLIGFGIVLPLLPKYAERFGAQGFMIGLIISSFSVMQFLFAPAWGRLSDRIGRRPVLLISNAGSAVSYALFALASLAAGTTALWVLLASRVFAGICGANLSVASAYIADVTERENRSKSMGLIGMAFGLGFILGPALGALSAAKFGLAGPGWVAAVFCAGNFLLGCFILRESRKPNSEPVAPRPRLEQWLQTVQHPKLGVLIGIYFLATFCFASFETTLPLLVGSSAFHRDDMKDTPRFIQKLQNGQDPVSGYLRTRLSADTMQALEDYTNTAPVPPDLTKRLIKELNEELKSPSLFESRRFQDVPLRPKTQGLAAGEPTAQNVIHRNRLLLEDAYPNEIARQRVYYDEKQIGYLFAYCGLIAAVIQGGAIGRLIKRFGDQRLIAGSLVLVAISLILIPYSLQLAGLLLTLGLFATGSGINRAPTMGQISLNSPPEEQGAMLGIAQSAGTLARILGPVFATALYYIHKPIPYVIAGAIAGLAGILAWQFLCRVQASTRSEVKVAPERATTR